MNTHGRTTIEPSRRAFWLIAAIVVVLAFLGVDVIAEQQTRRIDRLAYDLETNTVPSIDRLTVSRGALQRETIALRDLIQAVKADKPPDRRAYEEARTRLDTNMSEYVKLPTSPDEAALNQAAAKELGAYEKTVDAIETRLKAGDIAGASGLVNAELTPATERVDHRLQDLIELNTNEIRRASEAIRSAREAATRLSYALHGLAALLAVVAIWTVARSSRTHEKLVETRARLERERSVAAERRAAELDMFAARVAHDLKNPLGAIALGVEVAERKAEDPVHVRRNLRRASNAIARAKDIIDGLLDFARAGGNVSADTASAELRGAIEAVTTQLAAAAERARAQVVVEQVDSSVRVACPDGPLLSVLGNLVGNAVKYVVAGSSTTRRIGVRAVEKEGVVRVEIDDTGPGIPAAAQDAIFDPYVRGPHTGQPGLGLGLATVKRIVEAHGGSVGVQSVVGCGSCFWFELPRAPAELTEHRDDHADLH